MANIFLVAQNTPEDRVRKNARASRGFLYYVSVLGITGARTELPKSVAQGLERVRALSSIPVCVGFGISRPEQVSALASKADGIIVGSAIVKMIHEEFLKAGKNPSKRDKAVEGGRIRGWSQAGLQDIAPKRVIERWRSVVVHRQAYKHNP
jgi:tryptophan synthase alpha chain